MHRRRLATPLAAALALPMLAADDPDLQVYVDRDDPGFAWEVDKNDNSGPGTVIHIDLTSQTWRGGPWTHQLRIYEPAEYAHKDIMLLFITGGSSRSRHRPEDDAQGFALAAACDARVAVLPQVPNQPLLGDRTEDDLIAQTFVNYLETGENDWPLLQPMVKSAVSAMDAVQEWAEEAGRPVDRFVVSGASKRGWTTWLTAAVDDRVAAIAPMVIPTLNMKANTENQLELWGRYSDQIADYTQRGLTETFGTPDGDTLWHLVDPYFYLDRIDVPVLQINGTNDPYWTHDSMRFFWDEIRGPKYVVYLPNAGHGLDEHREYATHGAGALVRHVATGREMPEFRWGAGDGEAEGTAQLIVSYPRAAMPGGLVFWVAGSEDRDFRDDAWTTDAEAAPVPMTVEFTAGPRRASARLTLGRPETGSVAALADLTYEIDGLEYHLSTPIHEFRPDPAEDLGAGGSRR